MRALKIAGFGNAQWGAGMGGSAVDGVSQELLGHTEPQFSALVIEQAPQGGSRFVLFAVLFPALIALMTPFWLVVLRLAGDSSARAVIADKPLIGFQLLVGLGVLLAIFGLPLAHIARRGLQRSRIVIDQSQVVAEVRGLFGTRRWSEPLSAYAGVTHRVRSSLSGVRHDLLLVHRNPARSVVLRSAGQIGADEAQTVARLFAVAEIPSREAASFSPFYGYFRVAEAQSELAPVSS